MSLLEKIKKDQLSARKEKRATEATLLTTLIGEASMIGKNDGNRDSTDQEVMAVIKKFVKNLDEILNVVDKDSSAFSNASFEKEFLNNYLPQQLSKDKLTQLVSEFVGNSTMQMGHVMKWLKENYDGQYDGKLASQVVKKCLEN